MKLREITGSTKVIDYLCKSREIDGEVSYRLSGFQRRYLEVIQDVSKFEQNLIDQLELTTEGALGLLHPKQNVDNLKIYLTKREEFFDSEEVEIDIPVFTYEDLKPAKLSSGDINILMDLGMLPKPEEPAAKEDDNKGA